MPSQPDFAQNLDELFDVLTADGGPTSIVKRRADVHRDGDWHRSIHVWLYGVDGNEPFLLMNQRGLEKDTWPGVLDATVGGHLSAGETVEQAYREIEEEIGIVADPARLRHIGVRARTVETPGIIDREFQEVFLYRDDRVLTAYAPNPAELEGLVRFGLDDARRLFAGEVEEVEGTILRAGDRVVAPFTATQETLLPVREDGYFLCVAIAIERVLAGDDTATL